MSDSTQSVCAVIVTYHPDPVALRALLVALNGQVGGAVIVDNTSGDLPDATFEGPLDVLEVLRPRCNLGLAAAQNLGISWAREKGYRHVLILDQDSLPAQGMVEALLNAMNQLAVKHKVAAVGPRFHDLREDREAPFIQIGFPFNRKIFCDDEAKTIEADFLISSGSLVPIQVFDEVGSMDADLFIDSVDVEWSFRARSKGYTLHGICAATMHHKLGDDRKPLFLYPRGIVIHGAERLYYMTRNRLLLYRKQHVPSVWVAQDVPRLIMKFILFGVLVAPRRRHLRFMFKGLCDGLRGHTGVCKVDVPS